MTPCESNCACCQRHSVHIHSMLQRALGELNFYRKLLQMEPLTSADAFELSTDDTNNLQPASCQGSISRSAGLEAMPAEILDRIVQFVDGKSILSLCHSFPYYKYISTAMFNFAHRFPDEYYSPPDLWPDMYFPMLDDADSKPIDFPIQHLHAAGAYSRIISKHSGNFYIHCSENVLNYLGALPDVLSVRYGDASSTSGWVKFLCGLADAKKRIQSCTVNADLEFSCWPEIAIQLTRLRIQSLIWVAKVVLPIHVQEALPFISGLKYLEVALPTEIFQCNLSRCLELTEISFTQLLHFDDCEGLVHWILQQIKGSRIRKVWCKKLPLRAGHSCEFESLAITSDFLKHGWHTETRVDDGRVCFVYRGSSSVL
ncbi:hypothetical protein BJ741DRAFT_628351, partial [Chytriomyces cf. hyalinus JEL632]